MIGTLLGTKKQMVAAYDSRGRRVGATVVELGPNWVTQIKTSESKDGYMAVQIGFGTRKSVKKPQQGHFKKAGIDQNLKYVKEVKVKEIDQLENLQPGKQIKVGDIFSAGDVVKVTGTSKGKGFQGVVKKFGFAGGPKTHGQSDRHRAPGSIGQTTTPGRVYKGKKMAGHMGNETVSQLGVEVVGVNRKDNTITLKGGVPGHIGALVVVERLGRLKGYTPPPEEKVDEEEETEKAEGRDVVTDQAVEAAGVPEGADRSEQSDKSEKAEKAEEFEKSEKSEEENK